MVTTTETQTHVYWHIALRDFGLLLAAFALGRLAAEYAPRPLLRRSAPR